MRLDQFCTLPETLHPASRFFLDQVLEGRIGLGQFQRLFSLPNSDYLPLGECLVVSLRAMGWAA